MDRPVFDDLDQCWPRLLGCQDVQAHEASVIEMIDRWAVLSIPTNPFQSHLRTCQRLRAEGLAVYHGNNQFLSSIRYVFISWYQQLGPLRLRQCILLLRYWFQIMTSLTEALGSVDASWVAGPSNRLGLRTRDPRGLLCQYRFQLHVHALVTSNHGRAATFPVRPFTRCALDYLQTQHEYCARTYTVEAFSCLTEQHQDLHST